VAKQDGNPLSDFSLERERPQADRLIFVVGYGSGGERVAGSLVDTGMTIVVVDKDASRVARAGEAGHRAVEGDARDIRVLREARVDEADIVAVTTERLDEAVVHAIRELRPDGVILTHVPRGYAEGDGLDATSRMIARVTRILSHRRGAPTASSAPSR
jgi:voltage-gated potassium channel Kch